MRARWRKAFIILASLVVVAGILMAAWSANTADQTIRFSPIPGPIPNPMMGWAPRASLADIQQPHTLVYADLTWRDFEPQPGVFDFEGFETRQKLAQWRSEHQRVVFRFLCDVPGPTPHRDIPDWLYEATGGSGDVYDTSYGKGFSPDYSNPVFIEYHRQVIRALAERYGADGFFAYVELGSLGHWGEWHTKTDSGIRSLPPKAIRDQYVLHYREAFSNTPLLMRRPFSIARELGLGLYNDLAGEPAGTQEWLGWMVSGGDYNQTGEVGELVPMPNAWQTAPVGGEQAGTLSMEQLYGSDLEQTIGLLEQSHATFVGPASPARISLHGPLQPGIDAALSHLGYRLYVQELRMPRRALLQDKLDLRLVFVNDGIAPPYFNWPAWLYLIDQSGAIIASHPVALDVRKMLPGQPTTAHFSIPLAGIPNGSYNVGFAIVDPLTGQPAVRLAMDNSRRDLIQVLGTVEILWSGR